MRIFQAVAALLAFATLPAVALADDVSTLRAELQALKTDYGARVEALEARIQQLETAQATSVEANSADAALVAAAAAPEPAPEPTSPGGGASAFNPAISLILGGSFTGSSRAPEDWRVGGFPAAGDEIGPGERSFNLGESELTFSANIDPYFAGALTFAITGDSEIEVEEAFVRTTALHDGLTVKGGRFFSGFGYLNEVHAHAWDFVDQPLAYQAMFGGQYRQNGVQVKWLAPTDLFLEFGAETGNGDGFPSTRLEKNGFNGTTLFAHLGGDLGADTNWRAGAAWLTQRAEDRECAIVDQVGATLLDGFSGDVDTWVLDGVLKWAPSPRRQLKVQGEYLRREEDGTYVSDPQGVAALTNYRNTSSGWYLQTVYQFLPRWRTGVRYDSLDSGHARVVPALPWDSLDPDRLSLMLDWNPSEFSRLRAQYDWDNARDDGERDRIWRLQYLYGIGAHGAHKY